ncbi:MAG: hypothetical protein D6E12_04360 [Desulfovibrio sp.]|nr:MAG: hypothetical protein D6E12_04360 [Desulfovibrio sp.]
MEDERRIDTEPDEAFEEVLGDVDTHPLLSGADKTPAEPARPRTVVAEKQDHAEVEPRTPTGEVPAASVEPQVDSGSLALARSGATSPLGGSGGVRLFEDAGRQVAALTRKPDPGLAQELHHALMDRLSRGMLRFRLDLAQSGDLDGPVLAVVAAFGRLLVKHGGDLEVINAPDPLSLLLVKAPLSGVRIAKNRA